MTVRRIATPADFAAAMLGTPSPDESLSSGHASLHMTTGVIQSVQAGPPATLTLTIGGDPTQIPFVSFLQNTSWMPQAGQIVFILVQGSDHLVLGPLAGTLPQQGIVTFAFAAVAALTRTVTFAAAFPNVPVIEVSVDNAFLTLLIPQVEGATVTGFTFELATPTGSNFTGTVYGHWRAYSS